MHSSSAATATQCGRAPCNQRGRTSRARACWQWCPRWSYCRTGRCGGRTDVRANPPQHAPHLQSFLDTVTARPVDVPLRLALAAFVKGLARVECVSIFRGAMRGGLANVLAKIAGFVCELAHDYYEDADAPIASDLADAAKIKSMKAPDGSYVFPRAEDVGRDFALELLSMDSVRFA